MARKSPERRARTRQRIEDAFWELYEADPASAITVSAVVERAAIHRSTFYEYFPDAASVLEAIEDGLIELMREEAVAGMRSPSETRPAEIVRRVYVEHGDKLSLLLGRNGDPAFACKVKEVVKPAVAEVLDTGDPRFKPYVLEFVSSGIISAVTLWYANGQDLSEEELGGGIQAFVTRGMGSTR